MRIIPLSEELTTIVDDDEFHLLSSYQWSANQTESGHVYAVRWDGFKAVKMHREIMGAAHGDGLIVDHIDGNTLNNQKSNLRLCTQSENTQNSRKQKTSTSKYKGAQKCKDGWQASITKNGVKKYLGCYKTQIAAACVYNRSARILFGEFANVSEIPEENKVIEIIEKIEEMKIKINDLNSSLETIEQGVI